MALARVHAYDIMFMDGQMPRLDGFEATRRIRAREAPGRQVPIVAVTASVLAEDRTASLAAGMDDFLPKPITRTLLLRMLERWAPGVAPAA